MATVTSLTAPRLLALEAATVVNGYVNGSGHLILVRHDGTEIDAGNALIAVPGINVNNILDMNNYQETSLPGAYPDGESFMWMDNVRTAAVWPTFSGKWGNLRTVKYANADAHQVWTRLHSTGTNPEMYIRSGNSGTGWSSWQKVVTDIDNLARIITGVDNTSAASTYPIGYSLFNASGTGGWPNDSSGTIITNKHSTNRCSQVYYSNAGGTAALQHFTRTWHDSNGGGGWTAWKRILVFNTLDQASYTQTTAISSYPLGLSKMYFTATQGSTWDFYGNYGEVTTYKDTDDWIRQEWNSHDSGSNMPTKWIRTGNLGAGWTKWRRHSFGVIAVKDQAISGIQNGLNTYTITIPNSRAMPDTNYVINYTVTEQNNASFGSAVYTNAGCRPSSTTQFLIRFNSNWTGPLSGYVSYTLTPTQGA